MAKRIILVHGRSFKPDEEDLKTAWYSALRAGLARDHDADVLAAFDATQQDLAYYGDISNRFLRGRGNHYDAASDMVDRRACLDQLKDYTHDQFFDKGVYKDMPYQQGMAEFLADLFAGPAELFGLGEKLVGVKAPDMTIYWNKDHKIGSDMRWRLTTMLRDALSAGDDILLVSHSLGTIICYDVLWKFSHYGEYQDLQASGHKVAHLVTLGSPLGNPTVQGNLKGAGATNERRFPTLLSKWTNISAEDDYICHDQDLADDFRSMVAHGILPEIDDQRIYNLSVRNRDKKPPTGHSHPHHGTGYLIHPNMAKIVADWLATA